MRVNTLGGGYMNDFSALEFRALEFRALAFWRCVGVREAVGRLAAISDPRPCRRRPRSPSTP
ncbi:hypothetical protein [Xanthobacter versatilis]|uniref:hypothetical protein n=1 Tax=Xanthobacter autotrophicus (strain ATCC BAA-1158 / Py2) TaxID=78245 RepID=UPI00372C7811